MGKHTVSVSEKHGEEREAELGLKGMEKEEGHLPGGLHTVRLVIFVTKLRMSLQHTAVSA